MTNLGNDAMETAALVAESAFSSSEFAEVARGSWTNVVIKPEDDSSDGPGVDCDVKLWGGEWVSAEKSVMWMWSECARRRFCRRGAGEGLSAVEGA